MNKIQTTSSTTSESPNTKPRRLGRGLSALLGSPVAVEIPGRTAPAAKQRPAPETGNEAKDPGNKAPAETPAPGADSGERLTLLALDDVRPSRFQPRRSFDEAQLAELAASIRSAGVVQPIVVRRADVDGKKSFELIAGERRWRAARLAGLSEVPAVVTQASDEQAAEWALIENLQRADLRPMERADAVRALVERFSLSHAQAAEKLGVDRSSVANMVRMTELEMPLREMLDAGTLTAGHGKALLGVEAGAKRVQLAKRAAEQGWSVRKLEQMIAMGSEKPAAAGASIASAKPESAASRAAAVKDLERQLSEHLGTNVRIRTSSGGKRGSLVIRFFDLDHFDGLMQKFGFSLR